MRRGYKLLALLGILGWLLNALQSWAYINMPPSLNPRLEQGSGSPLTCSVLVAGAGLDEAEEATGLRDLAAAQQAILETYEGSHRIRTLHPSQPGYSSQLFLDSLAEIESCDRLLVYLTGHGGGINFGANSRFNLSREAIWEALSQVDCKEAVVVVDCCWSGQFAEGLESLEFSQPLTLITSTDAKHPAPFPVSFLSPSSYGRMWFDRLHLGEREAFEATNKRRSWLKHLYPEEFGLRGTWTRRE